MVMEERPGVWFVYRSHYEGPLSRRVRRLNAPSILAWFQDRFQEARGSATPAEVGQGDLGGPVHGLGAIFEAVKEQQLPTPKTVAALTKLLRKHLQVEGGPDPIRIDDHTLRVLTGDGKIALAYYFFDDSAVRRHRSRIAYLLQDDPRLPNGDAEGKFEPPVEVPSLLPDEEGEGTTYACLLTFHDGDSIPGKAVAFPGVRLPGLAAHLRRVVPASDGSSGSAEHLDAWPVELRLLRAMVEPSDRSIAPALARCAAYPLSSIAVEGDHARLGVGAHEAAREEFAAAALGRQSEGDPSATLVHEGTHVAVLCAHTSPQFGHQQWILFDDRWGVAQPELAASLLHYARGWDPFVVRKAPARSPEELAAARKARGWKGAVGDRAAADARAYRTTDRFTQAELVQHAKFGLGVVQRVELGKVEVLFKDGPRILAHCLKA